MRILLPIYSLHTVAVAPLLGLSMTVVCVAFLLGMLCSGVTSSSSVASKPSPPTYGFNPPIMSQFGYLNTGVLSPLPLPLNTMGIPITAGSNWAVMPGGSTLYSHGMCHPPVYVCSSRAYPLGSNFATTPMLLEQDSTVQGKPNPHTKRYSSHTATCSMCTFRN